MTKKEESPRSKDLVRVFVKGGILGAADLKKIVSTAKWFDSNYIHFGSRQDILFSVDKLDNAVLEETFASIDTQFEIVDDSKYNNIVSSYTAANLWQSTPWVHTDTYHYVLDGFKKTKLKVNVVDPVQPLVPLYSGDISFIASPHDNYWFVYLNLPAKERKLVQLPILVYTYHVAKLTAIIEEIYFQNTGGETTVADYVLAIKNSKLNIRETDESVKLPTTVFPDYEGFHETNGNKWWLGLYWRNNKYYADFLMEMCNLCAATKVGKIALTPWKSFIVKDISNEDKMKWEMLLGKYGINPRHSLLELNWHVPILDEEAMLLKRFLVRAFDQNDIHTSGLSFTIKTAPMVTFTSVIIEKNPKSKYTEQYELEDTYNVLHTKNFNRSNKETVVFKSNLTKEDLPPILMELSKYYYSQLDTWEGTAEQEEEKPQKQKVKVHQCTSCLTVYNPTYGDVVNNVAPGVPFEALPDKYTCPLCEEPKSVYQEVEMEEVW